jgi:hypothetical protein
MRFRPLGWEGVPLPWTQTSPKIALECNQGQQFSVEGKLCEDAADEIIVREARMKLHRMSAFGIEGYIPHTFCLSNDGTEATLMEVGAYLFLWGRARR